MRFISVLSAILLISSNTFAGDNKSLADQAVIEDALRSTQEMLNNSELRQKESRKTPEGKAAADKLEKLGGSQENIDAMYSLASEIFENLVRETGGDTEKMKKIIQNAEKDPAGFAEKWSASQKAKLNKISNNIPLN